MLYCYVIQSDLNIYVEMFQKLFTLYQEKNMIFDEKKISFHFEKIPTIKNRSENVKSFKR